MRENCGRESGRGIDFARKWENDKGKALMCTHHAIKIYKKIAALGVENKLMSNAIKTLEIMETFEACSLFVSGCASRKRDV